MVLIKKIFRRFLTNQNILTCILVCLPILLLSQNQEYARSIITHLASAEMSGRGYVNNGSNKAADYIADEMKKAGLSAFNNNFKQYFEVNVKAYPGAVKVELNGRQLIPAEEFTIAAGSPSVNKQYRLRIIDTTIVNDKSKWQKLQKRDLRSTFIGYDPGSFKGRYKKVADSMLITNFLNAAGYLHVIDKPALTWSVMAPSQTLPYPVISLLSKALPKKPKKITAEIELESLDNYEICNVAGYLPGTVKADSFLVITAHYDHLGMMGRDVYFPGANDNASGVAMLLDMAGYFSKEENRPPYSLVFMAFAGEEIGLKGSEFAASNPLFPLKNIGFLINLDMVGTGSEGITVVNANKFEEQYKRLVEINADNEYLLKVAPRGESCNSDHCPFYKKGVPAVFIYSMGREHTEYHNTRDQAIKVPLTEYEDIFRLLRDFIRTF